MKFRRWGVGLRGWVWGAGCPIRLSVLLKKNKRTNTKEEKEGYYLTSCVYEVVF